MKVRWNRDGFASCKGIILQGHVVQEVDPEKFYVALEAGWQAKVDAGIIDIVEGEPQAPKPKRSRRSKKADETPAAALAETEES